MGNWDILVITSHIPGWFEVITELFHLIIKLQEADIWQVGGAYDGRGAVTVRHRVSGLGGLPYLFVVPSQRNLFSELGCNEKVNLSFV